MKKARFSCVYFIQAGLAGPIKIGTTNNLPSRFRSIQCGNHEVLKLLANVPGDKAVERIFQLKLSKHHLRGEWYKPHKDVFDIMESAQRVPILDQALSPLKRCCKCGVFLGKQAKGPNCKNCRQKERRNASDP